MGTSVQKYYATCMTDDYETVTLTARAVTEAQASEKIHRGYRVMMVMDILNENQHLQERQKLRRSLVSTPTYH